MKEHYYVKDGSLWRFDGMLHYLIADFHDHVPPETQVEIARVLAEAAKTNQRI